MDVIASLKADHRKVEGLFADFEALADRPSKKKQSIVSKICEELTVHATIEEKVLYPFAREHVEKLEDEVLEAYEEHGLVKGLIAQIKDLSLEDETLKAKVTVLKECVQHHVEEEESELFPGLRKSCTKDELEDVGDRLEAARAVVKARLKGASPRRRVA